MPPVLPASSAASSSKSRRVVDFPSSEDESDGGVDGLTHSASAPNTPRRAVNGVLINGSGSGSGGLNGADNKGKTKRRRSAEGVTLGAGGVEEQEDGPGGEAGSVAGASSAKRIKGNGAAAGAGVRGASGETRKEIKTREAEARLKEAERLFEVRRELPFYKGRRAVLEEVMAHETTIILGETGCGKSTQLPQLLRRHALSLAHYSPSPASASETQPGPNDLQPYPYPAHYAPRIGVTQPRRLPAIALATRVAAEMGSELGREVGYTVRFEDRSVGDTGVRYLTEGVLMRELANGGSDAEAADGLNLLLRYDVLVLDEAHERTLNTDFLCGALKKVQRIRRELAAAGTRLGGDGESAGNKGKGRAVTPLKIVVMSATLDPSKFVRFFETDRPALVVKGRMYDVVTRHLTKPSEDFVEDAARQVMQLHLAPRAAATALANGNGNGAGADSINGHVDGKGDILVFMPGQDEIETCAELLRRAVKEFSEVAMKLEILPLYAQLPPQAQAAIFAKPKPNTRRVVIATNIAETSMTIPGVSFVVDTGYKKEKEYIYRTSGAIEHLKMKSVSKAAAWQRTGRAGRERPGKCFRLYTEGLFDGLPDFDAPEIQRCNLAAAVLQLVAMGQNPLTFEYIDHPGREPIAAAYQTLAGLEAISSPTTLTPLGRQMLRFPLDPAHARILLASLSPSTACVREIIDILSLADAGHLWVDRQNERDEAAVARTKFASRDGDHLTGMNVLRAFIDLREANANTGSGKGGASGQGGSAVRWAKDNYVNVKTLTQALKVREQLRMLVQREGRDPDESCGVEYDKVKRCLLAGLFMNTAVVQSDGTYRQTAGSLIVKIHPSSVLARKKVPAIMYDELAITSAMYARGVTTFEQSWLLEIPWFKQAASGARAA